MTATLSPSAIPGFRLGHPEVSPRLPFSAAMPAASLTEKHRPATLADMVGQGAAVFQLGSFLEAPAPKAFLFAGPTGVGKTTAARALANDLGVSPDWGFHLICSGQALGDEVDDALRSLRHACPAGSGWKMVLCDEADLMSPKAAHLWLSALEDLPPHSVVVFTTNAPEKFPDRFLDRCERIDFASEGAMLNQDAQALVDRVWLAETGRDDAPRVAELPNVVDKNGVLSFRRCVAALDPMIRLAIRSRVRAPVDVPSGPGSTCDKPPTVAPAPGRKPAQKHGSGPRPTVAIRPPVDPDEPGEIRRRLAAIESEFAELGERAFELESEEETLKARLAEIRRLARK